MALAQDLSCIVVRVLAGLPASGDWTVGTHFHDGSLSVSRKPGFLPDGPLHQLHRQLAADSKVSIQAKNTFFHSIPHMNVVW